MHPYLLTIFYFFLDMQITFLYVRSPKQKIGRRWRQLIHKQVCRGGEGGNQSMAIMRLLAILAVAIGLAVSVCAVNAAPVAKTDTTIFTTVFKSGAPPCISCHSMEKAGIAGGRIASDLSAVYDNFGKDKNAIMGFFDSPPSLMASLYKPGALSKEEVAKLAQFFEMASTTPVQESGLKVAGNYILIALGLALALFALFYLFLYDKERA